MLCALYTLTEFNTVLKPKLLHKIETVVETVQLDLEFAISVGIPLDKIKGMNAYLQETAAKYPELAYLAVTDNQGLVLYRNTTDGIFPQLEDTELKALTSNSVASHKSLVQRLRDSALELLQLLPGFSSKENRTEHYYLPLKQNGEQFGKVQLGLDNGFIRSQLSDVFFDIAIVLIAVLLVSFEIVMVLVMFYVTAPLRRSEKLLERQSVGDFSVNDELGGKGSIDNYNRQLNKDSKALQQVYFSALSQTTDSPLSVKLKSLGEKFNLVKVLKDKHTNILDARIPLFVFAFAEELQKSFMPLFVAEYYEPSSWLTKDIMLALPISIFMFMIAIITPFAGAWVDRWGNKKLFLIGLIPALLGYLGCAYADSSYQIIFWRGTTAIGYAIITISCQSYIAAAVPAKNRAKGMAVFVGVLMTATMSGTALGGIIADRMGYQSVFLLSAALTLVAGVLAWMMLTADRPQPKKIKGTGSSGGLAALAGNRQFVSLIIFCAIPAKIILTGFLYYLVPLYLVSLDASQSEIGRIMMVYALVIIPFSPLASSFADRSGKMLELVVLGTIISGTILITLYDTESIASMLIAIALMGGAHSILKAPLIAAALTAAEQTPNVGRTTVLGVLRTSERIGSVLGPLFVGALLLNYSYSQTMAIIGMCVVASGLIMAYYLFRAQRSGVTNQ
ncbi:MAG: MFS transporter [Oceanospirillaceae bacterium]|nr:MFS transporter [Oceanospirillaceae bacterium]